MGRYVIRRLLWAALIVFVVTLLTFVIFYVMPPGDPAIRFAGKQPTEATIREVREQLGLDKSLPKQYYTFVERLVTGDAAECPQGVEGCGWPGLWISYDSRTAVRQEIIERGPRTISLALGGAILWLVLGVSIGIISALKRRSLADRLAMGFALFGISAPVFWLGLLALFIFGSEGLGIDAFSTGYVEFSSDPVGWFSHLVLPWSVLALLYAAFYARMTRGNLIDTLGEDYIRTARAKGLPERKVIMKHGLRASLTPVVTMFGMDIALLIGGAVITETVFNLQGLGNFAVNSAASADLPAVVGVTLVLAVAVAVMSLVVDVVYAYLDPRVRYS
ncbi:MAG: ABC transporter permease [Actinobacteria bacterium]|nr:ABC transporter permease [Actinomycetota bacterium]